MQDVPKIARQRLKAAKPAATHPDADVLTAFTERSLPVDERAAVLEHLSRCGDCRDIVALALPATEAIGTVVRPPAQGWLTWPALRWGLVAAGVLAVASLGIVQYQRGMRSQSAATTVPAHNEVAVKEAKNEMPAAPVTSDAKRDKVQTPPAPAVTNFADSTDSIGGAKKTNKALAHEEPPLPLRKQAREDRRGALAGSNLIAGRQFPHGPRLTNQMNQMQAGAPATSSQQAKQQAAGQFSSDMQVPAVSETVAVDAQSSQLDVTAKNVVPLPPQNQPASPPPPGEGYALMRAKPPVTDQASAGAASGLKMAAPAASGGLAASISAPRWTISSAGGLQRSFDHGNTWQDVDVMSGPAFASSSAETSTAIWRAKDKEAEKSKQQQAPTFRAVSATGSDVWAGGSALYHSPDSGLHWNRVVPASGGTVLTGQIISLEFIDLQHGKVSTSTAEIWTTADDGQTWQKQ